MKTEQTHTPGPWKFTPMGADYRRVLSDKINAGGNWHVALVQSSNADAQLISKAPELFAMLDACQKMLSSIGGQPAQDLTMKQKALMLQQANAACALLRECIMVEEDLSASKTQCTFCAPVRLADGKEWVDYMSAAPNAEAVEDRAEKECGKLPPSWHKANPIQRIRQFSAIEIGGAL